MGENGTAMEPLEFLRGHPPWSRLDAASLRAVEDALEIAYAPRGTRVLRQGGPPATHLYVVRKGSLRLERDGRLLQSLEDGDPFGFPSLIGRASPHADVVAAEDSLLYQLPEAVFRRLMETSAFADAFVLELGARLRRAAALEPLPIAAALGTPISSLPVAAVVDVPEDATVGDAARRMREEHTSAVLVRGEPPGLLTDSDLRRRVLAEGRGPETPATAVASRPIRTIGAGATLAEALVFMLEHHVHHAPVERDGRIVGLLADGDLLRLQAKSPLALLRSVERLSRRELPRYATDLAATVESLSGSGLEAARIGPVVSRLNDALAVRLLRLAEEELGPPPCPYAWIVHGAEGRLEQALLTDQDDAIAYADDDADEPRVYFTRLAALVVGDLVAAGFPPCPGGYVATGWTRPLAEWRRLFRGMVEAPEPEAMMRALNFLDFRPVAGTLSLAPLEDVVRTAGRAPLFVAHLARASIGLQPPLGPFRTLRRNEGGIDLKRGGLTPIASLARLHAVEAGRAARPTLERLEAAAEAGTLSREGAAMLAESFRFLSGLRLREQLQALREGRPLDDRVTVEALSPLERRHLKDVFVAIREVQEAVRERHETDRLA
jgi:CBS domain-containing protein